jgi:exodeoxyribonuclease-3
LLAAGYQALFSGQKTYNGVAILSRSGSADVVMGIDGYTDPQKRVIAATVNAVRVICVYIPNGESVESVKYRYKLDWLMQLSACLKQELGKYHRLALVGDYNVAPEDRDVHDPNFWQGKVLFSEPESGFPGFAHSRTKR